MTMDLMEIPQIKIAEITDDEKTGEEILYLCDGELEECKKSNCYKNNGSCNHTSDIRHAKNFHKISETRPVFYEKEAASEGPDTATGLKQ